MVGAVQPGRSSGRRFAAPLSGNTVRRHTIVEENRLIVGMNHEGHSSKPGRRERLRLVSAERPLPSASSVGGGKSLDSGRRPGRREGRQASACPGYLRVASHGSVSAAGGQGRQCVSGRKSCGGLLRVAPDSSERSLRQLRFHVPRLPSNPALHRAPPRNVSPEVSTYGCALPRARLRACCRGGAGEL